MAITYKSQGSGVSTETSAAALSPLCPATVDAGDILIAHVFWEGTTTAPSTPSGWELLSGPHVIETTIARHWVFGKIASGSEDGAAVAFGNPAVTTQRGARVYSFAGRLGGTIKEIVNGFVHTSNAADPTFPTVTTTLAGALAVALIGQNDNNTLASATGETGGDWTEATAEFTANLTPGLGMGIQTCTPTGNPGTVSGGTDNTTNDPVGVIGFQIMDSNPIGVGALTIDGFAPTVSVGSNVNVTPDVGSLVVTGFSPTVQTPRNINADVGAMALSGFAPTFTVTDNKNLSPGSGVLTLTGFEPAASVTAHINLSAGVGELVLTGFDPVVSISDNKNVQPSVGVITFTGFEPTIQTPVNFNPDKGELVLTGFSPSISTSSGVSTDTGQLLLTGFAPTIQTTVSVNPVNGELSLSGFAPIVLTPRDILTGKGDLVLTGFEPNVSIGSAQNTEVNIGTGVLILMGFSPTVMVSVIGAVYFRSEVEIVEDFVSKIDLKLDFRSKIHSIISFKSKIRIE
jgi:hypothetical protein